MTISYREAIAITQVVFFAPALLGGIFLALRHGFSKSSGWVLLITFSLLHLIGAILEIISIEHPSKSVITGALVCISIGISSLTLICLGLLARVNQSAEMPISRSIFQILSTISLAGLCLGVYGGTQLADTTNAANFTYYISYSKIAIGIFTGIFVVAFLMFLFLTTKLSYIPPGEKRLLLAVGLSYPILVIRFTYSLFVDFAGDKKFNSFFRDATFYLCMAVLTEFVVVVICEMTGFALRKLPKGELNDREAMEMNRGHVPVNSTDSNSTGTYLNGGRRNRVEKPKRKFKGPISWLYFQAHDAYVAHKESKH
ncbi:uncharacterized protein PAC_10673 [Phialocephala subalpina]|uniref:DUF7702 domain-containing protein n=1 Tax=Phialocephala subalpina TaxID=576137 RepID=A0A1L7X6X1_9HELO|nr:uncharacterized protein PAC_10673 [Phialocephala subalpina]